MTSDLDGFAHVAWDQLWQVTVVAVVAVVLVRLFGRGRPRLAYALWMLVIVKSLVPPLWSSPTGLFSWALAGGPAAQSGGLGDSAGTFMVPETAATPHRGGPPPIATGPGGGTRRDHRTSWAPSPLAVLSVWASGLIVCTVCVVGKRTPESPRRPTSRSSCLFSL